MFEYLQNKIPQWLIDDYEYLREDFDKGRITKDEYFSGIEKLNIIADELLCDEDPDG